MMKLSITSPNGVIFDDEVNYVVIDGNNGQLALLENHSPIVVGIEFGFIKRINNQEEYFYQISEGIVEYANNVINVIAQEAIGGVTLEDAKNNFTQYRNSKSQENKRKMMDFTELEKELAKNIKEIQASKL